MSKQSGKKKHKNFLKNMSLRSGLTWLMVIVLSIFAVSFFIAMLAINSKSKRDYEEREATTVLNSMENTINTFIGSYKSLSRLVMIEDRVVTFLNNDVVSRGDMNDARYGALYVTNVTVNLDSTIVIRNDYAYINTGRGGYKIDFDKIKTDYWKKEINDGRGSVLVYMNGKDAVYREDGKPIISLCRAIYDINTQKQTGLLIMSISKNMLESVVNAQNGTRVCVVDSDGNYLAGDEKLKTYFNSSCLSTSMVVMSVNENDEERFVFAKQIAQTPLIVMYMADSQSIAVQSESIGILAFLLVSVVLACIIVAFFIRYIITKPIYSLTKEIETTKENGWLTNIDLEMPNKEMSELVDSYNSMIEYMNDLFTKLIENEKSLQKAEMRVLHEQIKPHFLYNSLETISYMAVDANAEDVHSALETLGSFYRNFLSKGDREIPLKREIRIIQDYIKLQKLRYDDIIEDEYEIEDETLEFLVPKLILQPLVENSINHGIRLKGEPGLIKISAFLTDEALHVVVKDTGIGMSEKQIEKILAGEQQGGESLNSFGLRGTIDRIRYYCGKDDVVTIKSAEGEYTEIELRFPRETRRETQQ